MNQTCEFQFYCPVKIISGTAALSHLPFELSELNAYNPLIVLSAAVSEKQMRTVLGAFRESAAGIGIYGDIDEGEVEAAVDALVGCYEKMGHDALVVVGGGTTVNRVKLARLALTQKTMAPLDELMDRPEETTPLPLAYVATPDISGLEAGNFVTHKGMTSFSVSLMPDIAVIDPLMMKNAVPAETVIPVLKSIRAAVAAAALNNNPMAETYAATASELASFLERRCGTRKKLGKKEMVTLNNACVMSRCALSGMTGAGGQS